MFRPFLCTTSALCLIGTSALAHAPLDGRAEVNWRYGHERAILMTEFWVPLWQEEGRILYGDLRLMGDDHDNREGNLGIGYRELLPQGVAGVSLWLDRRITDRGSRFHQFTVGAEWLGKTFDILANAYLPLSNEKFHAVPNADPQGPAFTGTGIVVDTDGTLVEEPQHGFDLELGWQVPVLEDYTDSLRVYGGGYYFDGDYTERVTGWRARVAADITPDIQIGARFQRDDERGSQGFLEATVRFPFGQKKSYRAEGLRARLDESPERDIDIVTGGVVTDPGDRVPVINKKTGQAQEVLHVDNTAVGGGDGSAERPFNALAGAQAAASAQTIIYVAQGDGTDTNQDQGITLDKTGQQLIGAGVDFVYDGGRFATTNGKSPTALVIAPATTAPLITNTNPDGDGITVRADDVTVAGVSVSGADRDGILVEADGAGASAQNVHIRNVTASGNRIGLYLHAVNGGGLSASVENSITTANAQHGIAVYDDTDGTFEVDLGGGLLGSAGNNVLAGNALEDLAVEYDGRTLAARNNWWGQASGPDQDDPSIGIAPQIYYGAPINDSLIGHWTFDAEWTTNTTAYDRSGSGNDGTLMGGLSLADMVAGQNGEALDFDGIDDVTDASDIDAIDGLTAFTFSTWMKLDAAGLGSDNDLLVKGPHSTLAPSVLVWRDDVSTSGDQIGNVNTLSVYVYDGNDARFISAPNDCLNDTAWHYITITYEANSTTGLRAYIDGILQQSGSTVLVDRLDPNGHSLTFGAPTNNTGAKGFDGVIDSSTVYNRVLSTSEISEIYRMDTSSVVDISGFLTAGP